METKNGTTLTRREMLKAMGLAAAAGMAAACAPAAPAAAPQAAEQPAAAPPATASKKMVLWGLKYDPHIVRYNALLKAFAEKTGVEGTLQPQDWPLEVKVAAAMSAGTTPDVCCMMGKVLPPLLVKKAVVDLTDLVYKAVGTDIEKDWFGDGIPCYTYEGKIYGVPTEVSGISLAGAWPTEDLQYHAITPEEAKQYPPLNGKIEFDSYEQMWELARKLQVEKDGKVLRYGISSAGWEYSNFTSILHQLDRKWWDPETSTFDFDNEDSIKAFKLLVQTPVEMGIEAEQGDNQTNLAQQGKVAVARGNVAVMFFLEEIKLWFETFVPPRADPTKPPKYMGEGGWGFVTFPKVANAENAIEFLKWLATLDGQRVWLENYQGNYLWLGPLRKSMELPMWQKTGDKYKDVIIDMCLRVAEMQPYQTYFGGLYGYISQVESACSEICTQIRSKAMTAEEGAKLLQERATNQYEQWKKDNELA